jgi:hypothetical protein
MDYLSGAAEMARHDAHWSKGYFGEQFVGRTIGMADGSLHFVNGLVARDSWSRLLRINDGGQDVNLGGAQQSPTQPLYANYLRFAAWIIIVLLPTPFALAGKLGRPRRRSGPVSA